MVHIQSCKESLNFYSVQRLVKEKEKKKKKKKSLLLCVCEIYGWGKVTTGLRDSATDLPSNYLYIKISVCVC